MHRLKRFIEHILSFSSAHLWVVGLLGVAAIVQAANIVMFDSFASGLYLGTYGLHDLTFNFFMAAIALVFGGWLALKTDRHFGKGFILFLIMAAILQGALFLAWHCFRIRMSIDLLFMIKWAYRLVVFTGFWSYVFRYIELSLKSKRFLFLVICEFIGFLFGGLFSYFAFDLIGSDAFLVLFLMSTCVLVALLWKVSGFEKTMPELQLKRNGGVSEQIQLKLVYLIYSVAFLVMTIWAFVDYTLCLESFQLAGLDIDVNARFFACLWALFGGSAIFLLSVLYTLRRSLRVTSAMTILAFVPLLCALGQQAQMLWVILFSKVLLELIAYFCVGYYFRIVPRPLSHGSKSRLKGTRLMIAEPAGFAFTALFFYYVPYGSSSLMFACALSFVFLLTLFDCQQEYSKVLLSAFKTFRWRGGRLMMQDPKVLEYVEEKASSSDPKEAVYFLRVLEDAGVVNLKNHLRHALNHKNIQVRLFALECIERNRLRMFKKTLSDVIDKDESPFVRQKALDVFCALGEKYAVEKAILYLDDPVLRKGALIGLLKSGGEEILIASEGVNKLAMSKNAARRLEAAEILHETGLKGFFRVVQKLIDDEDKKVQQTALLAAGKMAHTGLLKNIFKSLNDMQLRDEALAALKMFGAAAYPFIEAAFIDEQRTELCQKTLISYLWISEDVEAKKVLLRSLKSMDFKLRVYALYFLKNSFFRISKGLARRVFVPLIETDFKQALTTLLLIKDFRFSPNFDAQGAFEILCNSLWQDFEKIRQSLLLELYFYFPSPLMTQAVDILLSQSGSMRERQMAQSTLDDLLPKKYLKLNLILRDLSFDERLALIPSRRLKAEQAMIDQFAFILKSKSYRSAWTKASALGCIRKMDLVALTNQVAELLTDKSPIVRENAIWALARLVPTHKELKKILSPASKDDQSKIRQMVLDILK